ncbi:exo 1,3/1,4-beta-D-glucan glucohydrolase [Biformimicrobium ophioploci]|uniref:Exo 1,3/1,4-beta-D-glucan glucohydrolase n=2 Tax=Biformimicrobium ophioploci TaxID=3036711 RepID=A0ABQ6M0T7_9GAMM|nr:exo 1,3/1,4-beta-D-glucan glucohydrolase [Microbulbifer sp. NKW57]
MESEVQQDQKLEEEVSQILSRLSIEEKVGQIIQTEIKFTTPEDVRDFHLGSVLNGGGSFPANNKYATPQEWIDLAQAYYAASMDNSDGKLGIPIIWGTDAVHGHNNVIGATLFPHNIGLGATQNPDLMRKIGEATAREVAVTGIDWIFAPTVATARDDHWGRTYEGYSEDPELVRAYAGEIVRGIQGQGDSSFGDGRLVSTAKHFIGDGGTHLGIDRGDTRVSEQELRDIHGQGYFSALEAGVQTVMASFNSWNGEKLHGSEYMLTNVLKEQMGFDGFVVGDWLGHSFVPGCSETSCPQTINAGLDMFMASNEDWKSLYRNTVKQVESGEIPMARLDDAVTRILRVKLRAGLFDAPPAERALAGSTDIIGSEEHREIARQAVRESIVLLKNQNNLLPLSRDIKVLVAGDGADNIGKQAGGWTISWQGTGNTNADFPGATSIYDGIRAAVESAGGKASLSIDGSFANEAKPDVAIVVYGENPYAEMQGDLKTLEYQAGSHADLKVLKSLQSKGIPVVSVFLTGRPLWVNPEINASDAFAVAWLPGSEGAAVSDVLFRKADGEVNHDFTGRLSFTWPMTLEQKVINRNDTAYEPLFAYGYGLGAGQQDLLAANLPEDRPNGSNAAPATAELFDARPLAPWHLVIVNSQGSEIEMTGNRHEMPEVSISAVDRNTQEDSRNVVWSGNGTGSVRLRAENNRLDFSHYLAADSALNIELKIDQNSGAPVFANLHCGDNCSSAFDIAPLIKGFTPGEWNSISISLGCFNTNNVDFSKVSAPFELSSAASLDLTFSNVSIGASGSETHSCSPEMAATPEQ